MILYLLACLFLAVIFGGAYYAYRKTFYSPFKNRPEIPPIKGRQYDPYRDEMKRQYLQLKNRPCQQITVQSRDGLTLSGRYYHIKDGAPVAIAFHGYRSCALTDFSGGSELIFQMGYNLILVDQRAHGNSQGRTIAFGIQERYDCLTWIEYAIGRFGAETKILLFGISMGASTVLMASGLPLPKNVKGIVADCPYASAKDIICAVGERIGFPRWIVWPLVKIGANVYGGFDITQTDAVEAVKQAKVPILIIHGEADGFVPQEMSDIAAHNPECITRVTFPEADHGISYLTDTERYQSIVRSFTENVLA